AHASLHAAFWTSPALRSIEWLTSAAVAADLASPSLVEDAAVLPLLHPMVLDRARRGWAIALANLSPAASRLMTCSGAEWAAAWSGLPNTLLHGDTKVANFACVPGRGVVAFDWAQIATGPATLDIGWYIAINASPLARTKEAVIA